MLLLLVRFRRFKWLRYVFLATAAALLVLSRSAAALGLCLLMVAAMPLWRWAFLKPKQRLLACVLTVPTMLWATNFLASNVDGLSRLLGRDPTLSGRTLIWGLVWPSLLKRPILGYGYDAFWLGLKGESAHIESVLGWVIPHSHNGFLDLGLNLGAVGLVVYLYLWIRSFRKGIEFIRLEHRAIGLLPVTYLCFFALHNLFESSLLASDSLSLLLFAMITTSVAVHSRQYSGATQNSDTQQLVEEWHGSRALTPVRCDARLGSWG
jgi:O-antigen ligase